MKKKRVYLPSQEKKMVAMVPIEDLEALEAMENVEDLREAKLAMKEVKKKGSIPLAEVRKRLL